MWAQNWALTGSRLLRSHDWSLSAALTPSSPAPAPVHALYSPFREGSPLGHCPMLWPLSTRPREGLSSCSLALGPTTGHPLPPDQGHSHACRRLEPPARRALAPPSLGPASGPSCSGGVAPSWSRGPQVCAGHRCTGMAVAGVPVPRLGTLLPVPRMGSKQRALSSPSAQVEPGP